MSNSTNLGRVSIVPQGAWSDSVAYKRLDVVTYGGGSYIALQNVPAGTGLQNDAYWLQITQKGNDGDLDLGEASLNNAGFHNSLYRGASLGSSVTASQYNAIDAGTFENMYIGDYWTINSVVWRIAAFDYWYGTGSASTRCLTHHVVIVPDTDLGEVIMNSTDTTEGAYAGTDFRNYEREGNTNTGYTDMQTIIHNAFGQAHILSKLEWLPDAVTDGAESAANYVTSTIELMNEIMVIGTNYNHKFTASPTLSKTQLPLFHFNPGLLSILKNWWLRDVASATQFSCMNMNGNIHTRGASKDKTYVRPAFAIVKNNS